MQENYDKAQDDEWDFSAYAFTITGIIVGVLLVIPAIFENRFGIIILGERFNNFRVLSPLLFLFTTTLVFLKDALDARKSGGYTGSLFTHTFESLLEDTIYMAITTILVYSAALAGAMYTSWLTGPITWILFIFIFPLVKKKSHGTGKNTMPWFLLFIFTVGLVAEIMTGAWVAFPLSWLIICAIKLGNIVRKGCDSIDTVFDIVYYVFSVVLMAMGLILDFWMASWAAFPIALAICWILSKFKRFKKAKAE